MPSVPGFASLGTKQHLTRGNIFFKACAVLSFHSASFLFFLTYQGFVLTQEYSQLVAHNHHVTKPQCVLNLHILYPQPLDGCQPDRTKDISSPSVHHSSKAASKFFSAEEVESSPLTHPPRLASSLTGATWASSISTGFCQESLKPKISHW